MNEERFKNLLSNVRDIPALPDVVVKVMRMTRDPDITTKDLTDVISQDPGLTGNILKLCNSSYYGLPRMIASVKQAIMYLGFHTVRNLVLTCSMSDILGGNREVYGHGKGGLWLHSFACAVASEHICQLLRPGLKDAAFTAGLLQDVGKVIIHKQIMDTEESIEDLVVSEGISLTDAELSVLGFTHAEIGAALIDRWNFPAELVQAVRYHHTPEDAPSESMLTSIVHLADTIVLRKGIGITIDGLVYPTSVFAYETTGFEPAELEKLLENFEEEIKEAATALGIANAGDVAAD